MSKPYHLPVTYNVDQYTMSRQFAVQIAESEINRLHSFLQLQLEPESHVGYENLYRLVCEERKVQFDEIMPESHEALRRDFAAEAGYLIGLEVGKRLGGMR